MTGESSKNGARQESGQNEWHEVEYQGAMAKAPPCPERAQKTPLPQQRSSSAREEEGHLVLVEAKARYCLREFVQGNAEIP